MNTTKLMTGTLLALLILSARHAGAQGTVHVSFEGPPVQQRGTGKVVQQYGEAGVWFAPIVGSDGFTRMGGGILGYPENGTAYLQASLGDSLSFGMDDGTPFGVAALDLAEYSDVVRSPITVHFVGYRHDGSVLTEDITTAGIFDGTAPVFQTSTSVPSSPGSTVSRSPTPAGPWTTSYSRFPNPP
jgi:hypothetical protein